MQINRRTALVGLAAGALASPAFAQSFPNKPITFVVPYPPGGSADVVARLIGQHVSGTIGQPVVTENRGGANGTIGATHVAKSAPDGYKLLLATMPMLAVNPFLYKDLPVDFNRDLTPVSHVANAVVGIAAHPSLGVSTLPELIALAKKEGNLMYGSSGAGSAQHIAGLMLGKRAGTPWTHVAYRGAGPMVNDLLAGNVKVGIGTVSVLGPHAREGKLKLLAIGEKSRFPQLPDVPTINETVPGIEFTAWFGFFAPAGTPPDVVKQLSSHINRALALPEVKAALAKSAVLVVGHGPEEFARQIQADQAVYSRIIREENIKLQ